MAGSYSCVIAIAEARTSVFKAIGSSYKCVRIQHQGVHLQHKASLAPVINAFTSSNKHFCIIHVLASNRSCSLWTHLQHNIVNAGLETLTKEPKLGQNVYKTSFQVGFGPVSSTETSKGCRYILKQDYPNRE